MDQSRVRMSNVLLFLVACLAAAIAILAVSGAGPALADGNDKANHGSSGEDRRGKDSRGEGAFWSGHGHDKWCSGFGFFKFKCRDDCSARDLEAALISPGTGESGNTYTWEVTSDCDQRGKVNAYIFGCWKEDDVVSAEASAGHVFVGHKKFIAVFGVHGDELPLTITVTFQQSYPAAEHKGKLFIGSWFHFKKFHAGGPDCRGATSPATVTPLPTETATPTAAPTETPTATPTVALTGTPVPTDVTITPGPTLEPTPTPTVEPTTTPTETPFTATPTLPPVTETPGPTETVPPTGEPTPTDTAAPTSTPTPTVEPTDTPTVAPTDTPTVAPTDTPTAPPTASPTPGTADVNFMAIDTDITGNTPTSYGAIQDCVAIPIGGTATVDVLVDSIPVFDGTNGGIGGFGFNVLYDPAVVHVTGRVVSGVSLMTVNPDSSITSFSSPLPDSDGDYKVVEADSSVNYESGAGVLVRLQFTAVGNGTSPLTLSDTDGGDLDGVPDLYQADTSTYTIGSLIGAAIVVGGSCPAGAGGVVAGASTAPAAVAGVQQAPSVLPSTGGAPGKQVDGASWYILMVTGAAIALAAAYVIARTGAREI
jgi:hypothetical protein